MSVTIQKPSQGRVVIYTRTFEPGDKFVAVIDKYVGGVNDNGVDLGKCNLKVLGFSAVFTVEEVPHDDAQGPNTWRFPKHEPETIEVVK